MKSIKLLSCTLLSVVIFSMSCKKNNDISEPNIKKCLVTQMIDSSNFGIDTSWYTYDNQNRLIQVDYSNPYYSMHYNYQNNRVIEQLIINGTNVVHSERVFNLNEKGLATKSYYTGSTDTVYANFDTKNRLIENSRKQFDYKFEYNYDNNGDLTKIVHKSYDGSKIINITEAECYKNILLNPNANSDGMYIRSPWDGKFTVHAFKEYANLSLSYILDNNGNIKKTNEVSQDGSFISAKYFEYKCE